MSNGPLMRPLLAGGVVAIAAALAAAFLAWFAHTRGFSPEFWVALSGALVGGVLAMVGNYLGSRAPSRWTQSSKLSWSSILAAGADAPCDQGSVTGSPSVLAAISPRSR